MIDSDFAGAFDFSELLHVTSDLDPLMTTPGGGSKSFRVTWEMIAPRRAASRPARTVVVAVAVAADCCCDDGGWRTAVDGRPAGC